MTLKVLEMARRRMMISLASNMRDLGSFKIIM